MTNLFFKRMKFGHRHIQREDDVMTQGKDSHLHTGQGERPGMDPSLTALRRN